MHYRPRASGRLVLRARGPHYSGCLGVCRDSLLDPFFDVFSASTFEHQNPRKYHPKGPKGAPATPKSPQNPSPRHPESNFLRKVKTLENISFYCGLGTLGRPGVDVLAIKTAIVAPTTDRTPKNGENVGPKAPKVAQVSPNGARGGDR